MIPVSQFSLHAPLAEALADIPAAIMTGMWQTAKGPFLQHDAALAKRAYVSLGNFTKLQTVRRDPETFIDRKAPLTVDEAQRCPELLLKITRALDRDKRPARFLLSSSAAHLTRTTAVGAPDISGAHPTEPEPPSPGDMVTRRRSHRS